MLSTYCVLSSQRLGYAYVGPDASSGHPSEARQIKKGIVAKVKQAAEVSFNPMPNCRNCLHTGGEHNWKVPECSLCGRRDPDCAHCRRNRELRRVRGMCLYSDGVRRCICTKYAPLTDWPRTDGSRYRRRS